MSVKLPSRALFIALVPLLWAGDIDAQTANTTKYTYDALGRLTFVEDAQNGNRDYDYDKAGNRLNVAVGTADDAASNAASQVPPVPTGRSKSLVANCSWRATWTLSANTGSYTLKNGSNQIFTVYPVTALNGVPSVQVIGDTINVYLSCQLSNTAATEPAMVKACNPDGCSAYGNF